MVLPLANTGTVVSSPCSRSAARTWARIRLVERGEHGSSGTDVIGHGGEVKIDAFAGIALALAVERLVGAVLLEQDHRQQAGPDPPAGDDVKGCWRLRDR